VEPEQIQKTNVKCLPSFFTQPVLSVILKTPTSGIAYHIV